MNAHDMQDNWTQLGQDDPLWVVLTDPTKKGNKWEADEFFETGEREIAGILAQIEELGCEIKLGRALDFGCGVGRLTQALARRFGEADGVDISESMLEEARKYNRHPENCHYFLNGSTDLQIFPAQYFDFIYTNITLQHIEPRFSERYISEFCRVLAPHGVLIFQVPCHRAMAHPLTEKLKNFIPPFLLPPLVKLYRKIRYGDVRGRPYPRMEMHGIRRSRVERLLARNGVKTLDIREDRDAGPDWVSFRYYVTKE